MIAIILPTWNNLEVTTRPCLSSIRRFTEVPYRILVVDNASSDGTRAFLETESRDDPRIIPLLRETNSGWAGGVLHGLGQLQDDDNPVCILNSDTIVTPGWLSRMLRHLDLQSGRTLVIPNEYPDLPGLTKPEPVEGANEMIPGTLTAPSPPPLEQILETAGRVERRFRGRSIAADPSGFCMLMNRPLVPDLIRYLEQFESFRSGERDWREFWEGRKAACRMALDTYIFHARGGSGGYYRYKR